MRFFVRKGFIGLMLLMVCCIEPVEIKSVTYDKVLIVEGYLSGEAKHHKILLSNTSRINDRRSLLKKVLQLRSRIITVALLHSPKMNLAPITRRFMPDRLAKVISCSFKQRMAENILPLKSNSRIHRKSKISTPNISLIAVMKTMALPFTWTPKIHRALQNFTDGNLKRPMRFKLLFPLISYGSVATMLFFEISLSIIAGLPTHRKTL